MLGKDSRQPPLLRLFCFFFVSFFSFRMSMYFLTFCMFFFSFRFACKFRSVYICVILSCSFRVSLSSVTLVTFWFPETRFQHLVSRSVYRLFCIFLLVFCSLQSVIFVVIHFMLISRNLPSYYGKLLNLLD